MCIKNVLFIFILAWVMLSCKHPVKFSDYPEVSYNRDIQPLIIANCTQSGCHGAKEHERFELLSYDDLMRNTRINAGNPEDSKLYQVVTTYNPEELMPAKLTLA